MEWSVINIMVQWQLQALESVESSLHKPDTCNLKATWLYCILHMCF